MIRRLFHLPEYKKSALYIMISGQFFAINITLLQSLVFGLMFNLGYPGFFVGWLITTGAMFLYAFLFFKIHGGINTLTADAKEHRKEFNEKRYKGHS